ncbi:MAG: 2-oxoacid:acceptor oxidoreductase family protein [Faecalibacterium sp.]|nr:2-oxoacid:acceptor oxidoreductase family protein [Ruminococcus sp.]MCM1391171.1 2-oxoacid:acceptor oxidoreductase family protein [Ruminococcus sp.]MCM1486115.1 2-oxoacid:acceptor oxidoreductase family protein [Faecalibacterium sp.]
MKKSFIFSGSGGQGIMSAGISLAHAAIDMNKHSTYLPEYGPEQRGGSAKCTVIISDDEIISPLPTRCDNLIVMNELAYKKYANAVKQGGILLINSSRIKSPIERNDVTVISAPVDDIAIELGTVKAANTVLLGILVGATGAVSKEILVESLEDKFKAKKPEILALNINALEKGIEIGKQYAQN